MVGDTEANRLKSRWLKMLAGREHSAQELRNKAFDFSPELVEKILQNFVDKGWQSDTRFTSAFVRYRFEQGKGSKMIRYELQNKGIDSNYIDEVMNQYPRVLWKQQCERVYLKKYPVPPKNHNEKQKCRLFLARRGIEADLIREVIS